MSDGLPVVGRGFCFEDLEPGARFRTHRRTISEADLSAFVNLTWLTEELFAVADDEGRAIKGRAVLRDPRIRLQLRDVVIRRDGPPKHEMARVFLGVRIQGFSVGDQFIDSQDGRPACICDDPDFLSFGDGLSSKCLCGIAQIFLVGKRHNAGFSEDLFHGYITGKPADMRL